MSEEVVVHRLLNKDLTTMTGECSVCGFIGVAKSGRGFMCGEKKKAVTSNWRERNPEKAAANRRQRSDHELFRRDYLKLTAECAKCGPVGMTPWGRGYSCSNRASELRAVQESKPAQACRECWIVDGDRVYPVGGVCPRCADGRQSRLGSALRDAEHRASGLDGVPPGFMTVDLDSLDPYDVPEYESAVPGWRTVGTERPWMEV